MGKIQASSTAVSRDAPDSSCPLEWAQFCHAKLPSHRKILLTGATGRLGSHVLAALLARKERVRAIVRPGSNRKLPRYVEKFTWDLASDPLPYTAFAGVDRAIHLAGLVGGHPVRELMLHNAAATRNLVSSCPQTLSKLVLASSVSVYGEYKGQIVDEEFEPRTESPYGKSKLAAEEEARAHRRGIPTALLRFGMIYGPGFEQGYFDVFGFLERGRMRIFGDGQNRVPLVHADDAVRAVLAALDAHLISCREYNIVGEEAPTQEELMGMAAKALRVPPPTRRSPLILVQSASAIGGLLSSLGMEPALPFDAENIRQLTLDRAYSAERARRELGFSAKVKLASGIKQMAGEYKKKSNRDG
ncbi:MAG: NAD(P)-dependent oxidoreductase [Candidatus Micrarchaeota archaeon]|nr:NAD(P)-dependent oxidoreductase [Candidatus Micrarchaeota archaeon]